MPRLAWTELASSPGTAFLLAGELTPCFAGGRRDDDPFDSARLRCQRHRRQTSRLRSRPRYCRECCRWHRCCCRSH